jgi:hypothetical protein
MRLVNAGGDRKPIIGFLPVGGLPMRFLTLVINVNPHISVDRNPTFGYTQSSLHPLR